MDFHTYDAPPPFEIKSDPDDNESDADLVTKALGDFRSAVDERLAALETKTADTKLADRLKALETKLSRPGASVETKSAEDAAAFERKAFFHYVRQGRESMAADEVKALTVGNNPTAGYLAPPTFASEILKALVQFSPIRQYAKVTQIDGSERRLPRRTGTTTAYWTHETAARTGSQPSYEQVSLKSYELATFVDVSNQLLEDNAYNLEGELTLDLAENFAKAEGLAFVSGDGVGKPTGILTNTAIASMTSAAVNKIGLADITTAFHALPNAYAQSGVWMMNRLTLGSLRGINDTTGRPILLDPVTAGAATTLYGRPIVEAIDMPNVATGSAAIVFGDFSGYRIIDRRDLSFLRNPYLLATVGQTRLHASKRVGGDVTNPDRFLKIIVK